MKPALRPPEKKGILSLIAFSAKLEFRGFVLIILTLVVSGILEGVGMLTLFPLLKLVVDPQGAEALQAQHSWIVSGLQSMGVPLQLEYLVGVMCLGIFGKAIFLFLGMRMVTSSVSDLMAQLRGGLARASLGARWPYFQTRPSGTLVNRLTNETYKAGQVYYYACQICANAIQVLVYALLSLLISWKLTVIAALGAFLVMLLLHGFVKVVREAGRKQVEVLATISARFTDYLQGIKPLKAMGLEKRLEEYLERDVATLNQAQKRELIAIEAMKAMSEPVMVALVAGLLLFCMRYEPGSLPSLLALAVIFQRLLSRTNLLQQNFQNCVSGEQAFWWVLGEIETGEREAEAMGTSGSLSFQNGIEFKNVRFAYGSKEVLPGVSFRLPRKGLVLLRGPSGAGKTSIVDLLCRLQRQNAGQILVDGRELDSIPLAEWRKAIGYVPQEMFLLNDSLKNNLTLGDEIPSTVVQRALELSGSKTFVDSLQRGLDSPLGERGTSLSGGQRQRISLARALVREPKILILDEVTASLDPSIEQEICHSLQKVAQNTCVIAISHQQAFLKVADIVYTLSDGKLTEESGNPKNGQ